MPKYRIKHITRYNYPTPVIDSVNHVMLYPIDDAQQEVKKHDILITQNPPVEIFTDYFGNRVGMFSLVKQHTELTIQSVIEVITHAPAEVNIDNNPKEQWEALTVIKEQFPYLDFLMPETCSKIDEIAAVAGERTNEMDHPFAVGQKLSEFVYKNFEYKKGITSVETQVEEIWNLKAGVCQDFAHVLLVMLRMVGIPARYVSGYICPDKQEWRGEGATHAWVEAYLPFRGWTGFDPTNNCIASDRHVRLAVGRNFSDCTPVKGTYKGSSEHTLEVSVVIANGKPAATEFAEPVFTYVTQQQAMPENNSYRRFMEMQQQQ